MSKSYRPTFKNSREIKKENYENDYYANYRSDGPGPVELEASVHHFRLETYRGIGPKSYTRSDNSIEEEVCEILIHDRFIDVENVFISVEKGVVKLSGSVRDRREKFEIEDIAEHVLGVVEVKNEIQVQKSRIPESDDFTVRRQLD
ncbi:BON domain-containing protein [Bacteriovorax stolpii]|uniref:Uncharacterized protein n=1 Tax=Bacteriovorax stolpii TaxID=960 RepID=A0A2K9NWK1_BACTC|nr:BON domain-containing protein [Bacteriovorax stolpii]AUN99134.1 hypothetical protein C0V70_13690 [Bacteriovorax stolpii]QDK40885.1 BON domain-containing protein [Bacteriovorax stolpii]TDP55334.1 BON domain-containing protein [Bacteriovorax stolpii]